MSETLQSQLWRGGFGADYTERNALDEAKLAALTTHWARILRCVEGAPPASILEVGANIGLNLRAIRRLSTARLHALEPQEGARARMAGDGVCQAGDIHDGLAQAIPLEDGAVEMAFTSGVLIHIHPDHLPAALTEIHRVSSRYVGCIEYFSDKPETIPYRGQTEALFKRDFGGLWMDMFPSLRLLDYGFAWKRTTGLDNLTWWLFEKR
jgi:spore coat polysaccharide biosynthesis protein SpsF